MSDLDRCTTQYCVKFNGIQSIVYVVTRPGGQTEWWMGQQTAQKLHPSDEHYWENLSCYSQFGQEDSVFFPLYKSICLT